MSVVYNWDELPSSVRKFLESNPRAINETIQTRKRYRFTPDEIVTRSNVVRLEFAGSGLPNYLHIENADNLPGLPSSPDTIGGGAGLLPTIEKNRIPDNAIFKLSGRNIENLLPRISRSILEIPKYGVFVAGAEAFDALRGTEIDDELYSKEIEMVDTSDHRAASLFVFDIPIDGEVIIPDKSHTIWSEYKGQWSFTSLHHDGESINKGINSKICRDKNVPRYIFINKDLLGELRKKKILGIQY